jgi:hypothetical protein
MNACTDILDLLKSSQARTQFDSDIFRGNYSFKCKLQAGCRAENQPLSPTPPIHTRAISSLINGDVCWERTLFLFLVVMLGWV